MILLVEDESLICEMVQEALSEHGLTVHAVGNAGEALAFLASSRVDLLLTDINLPGEMDGAALAVQARQARPDLPVVFASGRWGLLQRLTAFPNSAILPKPYSLSQACHMVQAMLGAAQPSLPRH